MRSPPNLIDPHLATAPEPTRVVLVDRHDAMRRTLRTLLESEGMQVVAEAPTPLGVTAKIRSCDPQVLVFDLGAHVGAGLRSIRFISDSAPGVEIIATTLHDWPAFERIAREAGASGLVRKDLADPELPRAIQAALAHAY
jgi:DNA-binding NarL/FixJ family response regulator